MEVEQNVVRKNILQMGGVLEIEQQPVRDRDEVFIADNIPRVGVAYHVKGVLTLHETIKVVNLLILEQLPVLLKK